MSTEPAPGKQLRPRRMAIAALLSLLGTGVGHLYAGRALRGLLLAALTLAFVPAWLVIAQLPASNAAFWSLLGATLFTLAVYLFGIVDAMWCAFRAPKVYFARACNRVSLYVLLAVMALGLAVGGVFLLRARAFAVYRIPTVSMSPAFDRGDRIVVNMSPLRYADLAYEDVVIFYAPHDPDRTYVKRVVGLAGDTIEIRDDQLFRNGERLAPMPNMRRPQRVEVPPGHVFVLGDNREQSRDSREYGPISAGAIHGIAQYVLPGGPTAAGVLR